jgi:tetratricopeptide (TPR) repeat protein
MRVEVRDPSLAAAIGPIEEALERGDLPSARLHLLALGSKHPLDRLLLGARLSALEGDDVGAVRALEMAKISYPDTARVHAVAAEVHASAGRKDSAEEEIRAGLALGGSLAELERARGVLLLTRPGGAAAGLSHLEKARTLFPGIPFLRRPWLEANRILGSAAMGRGDPETAEKHARSALEVDDQDVESRKLLADAHAARGEFEEAVALYEGLVAQGEEHASALALCCQRAGVAALLRSDHERAADHYLRARELGLGEAELGFGSHFLAQEHERVVSAGIDAYEQGDFAAARSRFERALVLDPASIEAENHLGVCLFRLEDYPGAARAWEHVLREARGRGFELPEPVHLNLARALYQQDRIDEARAVLAEYLDREPKGSHAAATREMLERLPRAGQTGQQDRGQ